MRIPSFSMSPNFLTISDFEPEIILNLRFSDKRCYCILKSKDEIQIIVDTLLDHKKSRTEHDYRFGSYSIKIKAKSN